MKKLLLFLIVTVVTVGAYAQGHSYGVKAGVNITKIRFERGSEPVVGYVLGAYYNYALPKVVSFETSVLFSSEGYKYKEDRYLPIAGAFYEVSERLYFINIPIIAKFRVYKGIDLFIGPQVGFNVGSKNACKELINPYINYTTANLSGVIGAGYNFNCGFNVNLNYNFGLTNIISSSPLHGPLDANLNTWQFILGYEF